VEAKQPDGLAIGIVGHFPLGNVLVIAKLGTMAGKEFVGKAPKVGMTEFFRSWPRLAS